MNDIIIAVIIVVGALLAVYRLTDKPITININRHNTHKLEGPPPEKLAADMDSLNDSKRTQVGMDSVLKSINDIMTGSERDGNAESK